MVGRGDIYTVGWHGERKREKESEHVAFGLYSLSIVAGLPRRRRRLGRVVIVVIVKLFSM